MEKTNELNLGLPVQATSEKNEDYFLVRDIFSTLVEKQEADASKELRFALYKEMGNYHTRIGEWDSAANCYDKALEIEPSSDVIQVNLGTLEIQRNQREAARTRFMKAMELNPANPRAVCGLGILAMAESDLDGATTHFQSTLDLDAQNVVALQQLLALSHHRNEFSEVKKRLVACIRRDESNANLYLMLVGVCVAEKDWESCGPLLGKVLELEPGNANALAIQAEVAKHQS